MKAQVRGRNGGWRGVSENRFRGLRRLLAFLVAALAIAAVAAAVATSSSPAAGRGESGELAAALGGLSAKERSLALAPAPAGSYVAGEVLVEFARGVGLDRARAAARASEARLARVLPATRLSRGRELVLVRSSQSSTDELLAAFANDPRVTGLSRNYLKRLDVVTPNDPHFAELWGMSSILAPSAWSITTGAANVVIASVDTGVDYAHPDLAANMWQNPGEVAGNGLDDDANGYIDDVHGINALTGSGDPIDRNGHGTHTSATAAAVGDNSIGVAGVAWTARVMALKFIDGDQGTEADEITCINYAINEKLNHGVNVVAINASFGGGSFDSLEYDAVHRAGEAGIVVCAAAGNGGRDGIGDDNDAIPHYPSDYDCANIIAVAATGDDDRLATFSNYGRTAIDLGAPGVGILSAVPGGAYESWNGTSMATPHVTGAVALCAAVYPGESVTQRVARIVGQADPIAALQNMVKSGGRLNVYASLAGDQSSLDDEIPGELLPVSPVRGEVSALTDEHDVYAVELRAGQTIRAGVAGPAGSNFDVCLFAPGATSVMNPPVAAARAVTYPDQLTFTPIQGGTYYLDVQAVTGSGEYALTYLRDTVGPVCATKAVTVKRGSTCSLRYRVGDALSPRTTTVLRVKTLTGVTKKTYTWGLRTANLWRLQVYRCALPKGTYRIWVTGRDQAGNAQSVIGKATLTVR